MIRAAILALLVSASIWAQEASSGFEVRTTASADAFYSHQFPDTEGYGGPVNGGFRAMVYPTWKLNEHWSVTGAIQIHSSPYFSEEFTKYDSREVSADVLRAHIDYSRFWTNASVVVRMGQLGSAFGSFLQRYDDAVNPLIDMPLSYGYYYKGVTNYGLMGAEVDATIGKLDLRAQFVNSSPANPRSILDSDQYGTWAGGAGYTILQGFRVGVSGYRGPYLDRNYAYFFPGEANPKDLPASAVGVDVEWARGHWDVYGEWQRFQMDYQKIPTFSEHTGYVEVRRVLNPRLYLATRAAYLQSAYSRQQVYETAMGYRLNPHQLIKLGYEIQQGPNIRGTLGNTVELQFVSDFRVLSIAKN